MSKSAPTPRQNFLQTALLFTTIWLGMMLFCNRETGPATYGDKVLNTHEDVYAAMVDANRDLLDITIANQLLNLYTEKLDQAEDNKKISAQEVQQRTVDAKILVADTQLKAGIARNETHRIRNAYYTLLPIYNKQRDEAVWNQKVEVTNTTGDQRFGWSSWTPEGLYNRVVETLSERNKTELIWGFLPGGYQLIDFLVRLTGSQPNFSYAFAAFLLALVVRGLVYPLSQKQIMFGRQMSQLTPLVKEIKEKYKDDPAEQQKKTMELYQEYGVNPLAGCGPMFVQLPLFLTIYQCMLLYQFEFTNGTFLWINPRTSLATNGFVAPNLGQIDIILIVIYGISMLVTTMLMPVSDPTQVKQQRLIGIAMSVIFTLFMFTGTFPVAGGFVLYWTFTNILATLQSLRAYRLPLPPLVKVNARGGGVYPQSGPTGKWARMMDEMRKAAEEQQSQQPSKKGGDSNGSALPSNGKPKTTGAPAKHKPKKRK